MFLFLFFIFCGRFQIVVLASTQKYQLSEPMQSCSHCVLAGYGLCKYRQSETLLTPFFFLYIFPWAVSEIFLLRKIDQSSHSRQYNSVPLTNWRSRVFDVEPECWVDLVLVCSAKGREKKHIHIQFIYIYSIFIMLLVLANMLVIICMSLSTAP